MSSTNFQVNGTDFNNIFSMNSADSHYNKTVSGYTPNVTYNGLNGSTTQQNNIPYYYNNGATNYSYGIQAYYTQHSTTGNSAITIPTACNSLGVFLIGAGGSGGAGGGDTKDKKGTDGAGGGGGAYLYATVALSTYGRSGWSVTVGTGGASVYGSASGDNNGSNGNDGTATTLFCNGNAILTANPGGGGGGGHPTSGATAGSGGSTGGADVSDGSSGSDSISPGYSGYFVWYLFGMKRSYYPELYTSSSYGNGGAGTSGAHDPNGDLTGAGVDGYARIYYMV